MTDTFRALCAELTFCWSRTTNPDDFAENAAPIIGRMKAALSQPEPEGPTDEEILALSQWHEVSYTLSDGGVVYPMQEGTDMKDAVLSFTRAALTRWGRPAIKPVPVSERLPGPEDCDEEGRCWWAANDGIYDHWRKLDLDKALNNPWRPTHWLPHYALPVPTTRREEI